MATLQGKAVKNTYRQVLQIGANNVGVSGTLQPVQDGAGINTALSLSTTAATINGTLTITGDLIITGGGIQIQDLIDDTVASLIQNGTGITWAYNDTLRTLTPTITIATADGGVQGDFMQLNTGANEANAVAKIYWNSSEGTADLGLLGGQVILPLGQKQVARVLNNSGSIFNKSAYQVVKITAAQGQRLAVGLAQANNDANSTDTLGLVAENIANNQEGFITTSGLITNVDTTGDLQLEDWNDGDILYLSPTTPGAITKVKPIAPQHTVIVGFVVYAHKNNGKIYVKVDNGYELDELHNVRITAVADNNILQYNSSLAVWENVAGTTTNIAEGTNLYYTQARFDSAFAAKTTTNLAEGTNLYFTTARGDANFATNFATKTTTNLPEGTNLYYTDTRARLALAVTAGTGISYNNGTGVFSLASIPNASLTNSSVTVNSLALPLGGSITLTTTNIAEGTNLYWTDARFDSRFGTKTTTNLAEGTNLYYTQARFNTAFDAKTTTDLDEGTNLYYTDARSRAAISENAVGLDYSNTSGVLSLTSGYAIPTTVKLGEYDIAYNRSIVSAAVSGTSTKTLSLTQQDANVITATWTDQGITTINGTANQIAATTVGNTTTLAFTNDVTMPNNLVVSGNLTINGTATYVNTQSISAKDPLFEVANDNNTTDAVDIGYYGRYFDSAQTRVEFTGLFRDASDAGKFKFFTGLTVEPTNVVDTTGTGYTVGTLVANVEGNLAGTANAANVLSTARSISATGDAAWTVNFDGSANATGALTLANTGVTATTYGTTTSVPTIAVDAKGRITSASNTNIAFPVTTVNGFSGTVVLTTSDVAEGSNQYFTSARAQAAITGGASSVVTANLTASRALVSDGSGKIAASASTTATEVSYLAGVTSAIQTQLNGKLNLTGGTLTGGLSGTTLGLSGALTGTSASFSGNVGIGTSPSVLLHLAKASAANQLWLQSTTGTNAAYMNFINSGGNNFIGVDNSTGTGLFATGGAAYAFGMLTESANPLIFGTNNIERFRIASTGAATFSNSVTAGGDIATTGSYIHNGNGSSPSFVMTNTGGNRYEIYPDASAFRIYNRTTSIYPISILNNGNVGIGTSSPVAELQVAKASAVTIAMSNSSSVTSGTRGGISWYNSSVSTVADIRAVAVTDNVGTALEFYTRAVAGGLTKTFDISTTGAATISATDATGNRTNPFNTLIITTDNPALPYNAFGGSILFNNRSYTHGVVSSSRIRSVIYDDGGNQGGGLIFETTATAGGALTTALTLSYTNVATFAGNVNISGAISAYCATGGNTALTIQNTSNNTAATAVAFLGWNASLTGSIQTYVNVTTYNTSSDYRLKEDLQEFSGLDLVTKLKMYDFKWKEADSRMYGGLAHEIQEVVPYAATGKKDEVNEDGEMVSQGVDYSTLVPLLIKSIQELKAEIDELKAK